MKALITDPDRKVLLLRVNPEQLPGMNVEVYWDIPGGRVYRGDGIVETLRREIVEETGLALELEPKLLSATVSNIRIPMNEGDVGLILFVYECPWPDRPELRLSSEHTAFWWANPDEAANALATKYPPDFVNLVKRKMVDGGAD